MHGATPVAIQDLPTEQDRALVLGQLLSMRHRERRFEGADLRRTYDELRLPPPANLPTTLRRAEGKRLVRRYDAGTWALTPKGEQHVAAVLGELDASGLLAHAAGQPGAVVAAERQPLLPPALAPPRWVPGIGRMLARYPFDRNVFGMLRFPTSTADPVAPAITIIREILANHGLTLHLASDRQLQDDLLGNVGAYLWACQYGLGLLEDRMGRGLNYNTMIELGSMIMTGRRCVLLRDASCPPLPTDFVGEIYKPIDLDDLDGVAQAVEGWVKEDLSIP